MSTTITLKNGTSPKIEQWLLQNVGPRLHYLHNSIGGVGWVMKLEQVEVTRHDEGGSYPVFMRLWKLTLEDERLASWFLLLFPQ